MLGSWSVARGLQWPCHLRLGLTLPPLARLVLGSLLTNTRARPRARSSNHASSIRVWARGFHGVQLSGLGRNIQVWVSYLLPLPLAPGTPGAAN